MSPREIDYYDDPTAPEPNSLVPSASVVVVSDADEILMISCADNGNYGRRPRG